MNKTQEKRLREFINLFSKHGEHGCPTQNEHLFINGHAMLWCNYSLKDYTRSTRANGKRLITEFYRESSNTLYLDPKIVLDALKKKKEEFISLGVDKDTKLAYMRIGEEGAPIWISKDLINYRYHSTDFEEIFINLKYFKKSIELVKAFDGSGKILIKSQGKYKPLLIQGDRLLVMVAPMRINK